MSTFDPVAAAAALDRLERDLLERLHEAREHLGFAPGAPSAPVAGDPPDMDGPGWMTPQQVAWGRGVDVSTVYRWARRSENAAYVYEDGGGLRVHVDIARKRRA